MTSGWLNHYCTLLVMTGCMGCDRSNRNISNLFSASKNSSRGTKLVTVYEGRIRETPKNRKK